MQGIQAAFIDRDGTIGGTGHFVHPTEFNLFDGAQGAIDMLKQAGIKVFAFTNQHRISRGQAKLEEFRTQFEQYGFDGAGQNGVGRIVAVGIQAPMERG